MPEALDALIARCLEPDPDKRFQTTTELEAELEPPRRQRQADPDQARRRHAGMMAAVIALAVALLGGSWWYARTLIPPAAHDPVSVVIADFKNSTGDPTFDRTLEPMLKRALEGAGFISAYDRSAIGRTLGVRPPDKLDETAARELAVKQGLGVVLSGIDRPPAAGSGYTVSVKATQTVTGTVVADKRGPRGGSARHVLGVATRLVADVRKALGDETSESAQMFAMTSLSATSLDVVRLYAAAQEASSNNKFEDARQNALKAVELDPKFGIGYQLLSVASRNRRQPAGRGEVHQRGAPVSGRHDRARALHHARHLLPGDGRLPAVRQGVRRTHRPIRGRSRRAQPARAVPDAAAGHARRGRRDAAGRGRSCPSASCFATTWRSTRATPATSRRPRRRRARFRNRTCYATLALALAQTGKGLLAEAAGTYEKLAAINAQGASFAASGLGDLAVHEGRFSEAVRIFEQGASADLAAKNADRAAVKLGVARPRADPPRTERGRDGRGARRRCRRARR